MDPFEYNIKSVKELYQILRYVAYLAWEDITTKLWPLPIIVPVTVGAFFLYDLSSALLWLTFLAFLLYQWESRILGAAAILCLTACPILLALDMSDTAESVAVYAFFFLVMTVFLQLIDLKRYPENYR